MTLSKFEISVIAPKEATNLVTNPSLEVAATGYTAFQSTILRSTAQARRGIASLEVTPNANVATGAYYAIALTSGVQYSFSVDVLDIAGQTFGIYIANAADAPKSNVPLWVGTGHWRRRSVTWTADASATFRLYVSKLASAATTPYYADGWQLEVGAVSTYLDGSLTGFVKGQTAYRWNGTPNASTSWRSGQTRAGGTYVKVSDYARILSIPGLGMAPVNNLAIASSSGASYYQNTVISDRGFSILCNVNKAGDYALIEAARSALISAVKPDATSESQPLLLQIEQLDSTGLEVAETIFSRCLYESGLGGNGDGNAYNEKIAIGFRSYTPLLFQDGDHATALGYQTAVTNANYILKRGSNGIWAAMATGANDYVNKIISTPNGEIYAGGNFTSVSSVADTAYIAKWNGTAWSAVSTGLSSAVYAMVVAPDGSIYIGGNFTNAGDANGDYIVKWTGSAWVSLGTGMNGAVWSLAIGPDGTLYAGGAFTAAGGVANTTKIAKWNGTAWSAMGTGGNDIVYSLAVGKDGSVYAGGAFTAMGGVASTSKIAKWTGAAWTGTNAAANDTVWALAVGLDGSIYVGGAFTTIGPSAYSYLAKWDGALSWSALGTGVNGVVYTLVVNGNNLYAGGYFTTAGGLILPDAIAQWTGSAWTPVDVNLPGAAALADICIDAADNIYIGFNQFGTATSATVTAPNVGSATTYPRIVFTGPGTCYQVKNYTTGKSVFYNLTLLAGETAILDLNPDHVSFVSSFRGNILSAILPGSDLTWELGPGANNVSAFLFGSTTAATAISMIWQDQYWSHDGAVR
jgi:hypothetical protein